MKVHPSSLLTIKVENFHAVSHFKHPACLQLQHARDLGATVLESAKRMTIWSAFYYTHRDSYYPVPATQMHLSEFPKMRQQSHPSMSNSDQEVMRSWARDHGKCVRQRTVRQETTKFKAGTLPLNMYEQNDILTEKFQWPRSEEDEELEGSESEPKGAPRYVEQQSEYDTDSSVDELDIDEVNDVQLEDEEPAMAPTMAATELNFLFANSRSRSGRLVKTSSKALLWM